MEETVKKLVADIKSNITQTTGSRKDEIQVARAMLNDTTYKVGVYNKSGKIGTVCPSEIAREMSAITISQAARIPKPEAQNLMSTYEYGKAEAEAFVDLSKEFVQTYIHTGRKLPLGGREMSDVSLSLKHVEAGNRRYPMPSGIGDNGKRTATSGEVYVPEYETIKAVGPCPAWRKHNKK